jgi:hypothetical protein
MSLEQRIHEYRIGWHRRYQLTLATDDGHGPSAQVGGFDTVEGAYAAVRRVDAAVEERRPYHTPRDPELTLYFWLHDSKADALVFQGYAWDLPQHC